MGYGAELYRRKVSTWRSRIGSLIGYPMVTRRLQMPFALRALGIEPSDIVLDVGCANGFYTAEMARWARFSLGVEIDRGLLRRAAEARRFGRSFLVCIGDALRLPLRDASVDKALISGTMQSVDATKLLDECARVIKPGGILVVAATLCDHVLIRRLYRGASRRPRGLSALLLRLARVPPSYDEFRDEYRRRRYVTSYYAVEDLARMAEQAGFVMEESRHVPGGLAAGLVDVHHLVTWPSGTSVLASLWFFVLFYPLFWCLQRISPRSMGGNEILARFRRAPSR